MPRWTSFSCASLAFPATRSSRWAPSPQAASGSSTGRSSTRSRSRRSGLRRSRRRSCESSSVASAPTAATGSRRSSPGARSCWSTTDWRRDRRCGRQRARCARRSRPRVVVAVPVADPGVCQTLRNVADDVVCLSTPRRLHAVGVWYDDFSQTSDDEVRALLARARRPELRAARYEIRPLTGAVSDYDPVVERAAGSRYVLLGEASHGTREFYRERAEITKRLIAEGGFTAVAVEADWPDAYRVNCYVRGAGEDASPEEALSDFRRFPTWMWRNTEVAEFVGWLREYNDALPPGAAKVGFYGLDLYSLYASMERVIAYLDEVDPEAARRARERY